MAKSKTDKEKTKAVASEISDKPKKSDNTKRKASSDISDSASKSNIKPETTTKPRRGRPPKKTQTETKDIRSGSTSSTESDEKPKPRRGRPPKKKIDNQLIDNSGTKETVLDDQNKTNSDIPKPRRGRPSKKTLEVQSVDTNDKSAVISDEKPKPRRGRPPKKKTNQENDPQDGNLSEHESRTANQDNQKKTSDKKVVVVKKSWVQKIDLTGTSERAKYSNPSSSNSSIEDEIVENEDDSKFNKLEYLEGNPNPYKKHIVPSKPKSGKKHPPKVVKKSDPSKSEADKQAKISQAKPPVVQKKVNTQPEPAVSDSVDTERPKRGIRQVGKTKPGKDNNTRTDGGVKVVKQRDKVSTRNKDEEVNSNPSLENEPKPANNKGVKQDSSKNNEAGKSSAKDLSKEKSRTSTDHKDKKESAPNNQKQKSENPQKEKKDRAIYRYTPSVYSYQIQELNDYKLLDDAQRKDPFIDNFLRKISTFMREKLYVDIDVKIVLAVSGGIDSVVLTDVFAILSQEYHFKFEIAHYNHKLRDGSDKDENFVRQLANSYRVSFHAGAGNVKKLSEESGMSLEESARHLRYGFLTKVVNQNKADFVATAHNSNDSAETLLMNLFRGSGLTGLSGIPAKRPFSKKSVLIRPFLNITRVDIEKYAKIRKLFWVEDITNRSLDFTRNKIRHSIIPKIEKEFNPNIVETLHRTTQILRGADNFLLDKIKEHSELVFGSFENGSLVIKKGIFTSFTDFVKGEVLQYLFRKHFDLMPLPSKQLDKIIELTSKPIGSKAEVSKEITALNQRNTLLISEYLDQLASSNPVVIQGTGNFDFNGYSYKVSIINNSKQINLGEDDDTEFFDIEYMPKTLYLRNRQEGDRITPLGMNGSMSVSDYLTNLKIDSHEKNDIALLTDGVDVIWICGYRISDKYRLHKNTSRIMKITRKPIQQMT